MKSSEKIVEKIDDGLTKMCEYSDQKNFLDAMSKICYYLGGFMIVMTIIGYATKNIEIPFQGIIALVIGAILIFVSIMASRSAD